jgi:transcriptional regulator with XRE-family HTH domain
MAQEVAAVMRRRPATDQESRSIGLALLMLRRARGMSLQEITDATGCTKGNLSTYETGKREPKVDTLRRLTDGMGYTMADLWHAHELAKELTGAERRPAADVPVPGDGTLPPDDRWPPEEARKAAVQLAQEVGRAVAHCCLAFMELQAGGWKDGRHGK